MSEFILFVLIAVCSVLVSSVSQMMLKLSAGRTYPSRLREYLNPLVISAYSLFFGSTLVSIAAYRVIPLSLGPVIEALGYVFISVIGLAVLKERITLQKALGMLLIIAGVAVCALG